MKTLESLPLDLVFAIYEYLTPLPPPDNIKSHPFLAISLTSKTLRSCLLEFIRHLILAHNAKALVKIQRLLLAPHSDIKTFEKMSQKLLKYWLKATWSHCFACGKPSSRRAIMDSSLVCCTRCDRVEWGNKITMSEAMKQYNLKKEDLFGNRIPPFTHFEPEPVPDEEGIIRKRPGLKYGQFVFNNVFTTMFIEEDVRRLACRKYNVLDIDDHMRERQLKKEQRAIKVEQNRRKKKNYVKRLAAANGLNVDVTAHRVLHHLRIRKKTTPLGLMRNEALLKKLGLEFDNNYSPWDVSFHGLLMDSNSKCLGYITALLQHNRFYCIESWEDRRLLDWGGADCRFQRRVYLHKGTDKNGKDYYMHEDEFDLDELYLEMANAASELDGDPMDEDDDEEITMEQLFANENEPDHYESPERDLPISVEAIPIKNRCIEYPASELKNIIYARRNTTFLSGFHRWYYHDGMSRTCITEYADPVDFCLYELFLQEYGSPDIPPPTWSYPRLRDLYSNALEPTAPFTAPWSWSNYPLFVEEVTPEDLDDNDYIASDSSASGSASAAQEYYGPILTEEEKLAQRKDELAKLIKQTRVERRIALKNQKARAMVEETEEKIRRAVRRYGWDLLQQGTQRWLEALDEDYDDDEEEEDGGGFVMGGEDADEESVAGKGKGKAKGKGKGKGKAKATSAVESNPKPKTTRKRKATSPPPAASGSRRAPPRKAAMHAKQVLANAVGDENEEDD